MPVRGRPLEQAKRGKKSRSWRYKADGSDKTIRGRTHSRATRAKSGETGFAARTGRGLKRRVKRK